MCAHCHAWRLSHAFSVHCIRVKWNRSLLWMLTCAVLLVGPGAARMTCSDGGKKWNSCSIRITAWALGMLIVAERGTCYLLSRASLMLSQCMWLHGAPLLRGPWKGCLDFKFYMCSILYVRCICIARSGLRISRHPNFYIRIGPRNVLNQAWY